MSNYSETAKTEDQGVERERYQSSIALEARVREVIAMGVDELIKSARRYTEGLPVEIRHSVVGTILGSASSTFEYGRQMAENIRRNEQRLSRADIAGERAASVPSYPRD